MYKVADGFAFTSKRGIIKAGEEITEEDFSSHDSFVGAVAKKKIVVGKTPEQLEKEAKELAEKQKKDAASAERQ
jgi:hypothetical protein